MALTIGKTMTIVNFFITFKSYFVEVFPALALGLPGSGIIHEFIPESWVEKHLSEKGIKGIIYSTVIGAIVPVCCWGSLLGFNMWHILVIRLHF